MKRRLLAGSLALFFFLWLSLAFSSNLGLLLASRRAECSLRLPAMTEAIRGDPRNLKLLVLLMLFSAGLVLWMLFGRSYLQYKSDMYEVVPGFRIPRPEGQGQHGTAWFMSPQKIGACFAVAASDKTIPLPPELAERYTKERGEIRATGNKAE